MVSSGNKPSQYYQSGNQFYLKGQHAKALEHFLMAIVDEKHPSYSQTLVKIAKYYEEGLGVQKDLKTAAKYWGRAATVKNSYAEYKMGEFFAEGSGGFKADAKIAVAFYERSAKQNCQEGVTKLAFCCFDGTGVAQDHVKALELFLKAAHLGSHQAYSALAVIYNNGTSKIPQDQKEAIGWAEKAAQNNYFRSVFKVIQCYSDMKSPYYNPTKFYQYCVKAAEQKLDEGHYYLGLCHLNGIGTKPNQEQAIRSFIAAAEQKFPLALIEMAPRYALGKGVKRSMKKSFDCYWELANQKHPHAQYTIGDFYKDGVVVDQDFGKAAEWYQKAADAGYPAATFAIGYCYAQGRGVAVDYKQAAHYYEISANQHHDRIAQFNLALLYFEGKGVPKDEKRAFDLVSKSAAQEYSYACLQVAECYRTGLGVPRDLVAARKHYEFFAHRGCIRREDIVDRLDRLEMQLALEVGELLEEPIDIEDAKKNDTNAFVKNEVEMSHIQEDPKFDINLWIKQQRKQNYEQLQKIAGFFAKPKSRKDFFISCWGDVDPCEEIDYSQIPKFDS